MQEVHVPGESSCRFMRVEISRQPEAGFQTTRQQHYKRCGRECDLPAAKAQNDLPAAIAQKCQIGLVPSQCTSWQSQREAARNRGQRSTFSSCSRHRRCTSASGTMTGASQPPRRCAHGILAVLSHGRAKHHTAFPKQACRNKLATGVGWRAKEQNEHQRTRARTGRHCHVCSSCGAWETST